MVEHWNTAFTRNREQSILDVGLCALNESHVCRGQRAVCHVAFTFASAHS